MAQAPKKKEAADTGMVRVTLHAAESYTHGTAGRFVKGVGRIVTQRVADSLPAHKFSRTPIVAEEPEGSEGK